LAFSRRQRTERRTLSLPAELQRSMDLLRSMLPRSVDLQVAVEPDAAAVVGDSVQIEQVLLNLCINARDAVDGTGSIRVRVSSESIEGSCSSCRAALRGGWTVVSVTDSGAGIAPAVAERMFEPFYTTKPAGRGSGMGLAMVHGIVHEHDGHVLVDNVQPHGARFRVLLPPSAAVAEAAPQRPADVPPRSALAGRVLLVEDEPSVAGFMVELLESWGLQVTYCADARAADEHLQVSEPPFDVLLTDHTMPGTTGLELARRATDRHPMLPVLLYTGFGEDIEAAALQRARVRAMLRKPIEREALRSELERVLQR
ncbi:MAG TPA: ATP-binding protein, partial [Burkholderiaceae bacterium]|nr:ATP-binding protein [Burkholderiaceae bacterium]